MYIHERLLPWILTASACLAQALTTGVSFSVGVYYMTFLDVFQSGNGANSWIGSLNLGMLCAVGPLASYLIDKLGVRNTVIIGGMTSSVGLLVASFSPSLLVLFVSLGIITGLGYGLVFTSAVVVIGVSLTRYRTLAMGISISGVGLGNFTYPFLATYLMEFYGWRGALLITSGITLNVCLMGMFMVGKAKTNTAETSEGQCEKETFTDDHDNAKGFKQIPLINVPHASSVSLASSRRSHGSGRFTNSMKNLAKFSRIRPYLTDAERAASSELIYSALGRSTSRTNISRSSFTSMQSLGNSRKNLSKSYQRIPVKSVTDSAISMNQKGPSATVYVRKGSVHDKIQMEPIYLKSTDNMHAMKGDLLENHPEEDDLYPNKLYSFTLPSYWLIHANVILFCLSLSVVLTHAAPYSQYNGLSTRNGNVLISVNGAMNVIGRIFLGAITQLPVVNTFLLYGSCYLIAGVAVLLMTVWTSFSGLAICIATFGTFSAAYGPVLAEATLEVVGVENFNYAYGFLMISMALGTTLGAPLAGWLYDLTLQYTSSFYFGGSCLLLSALLMLPLAIARASSSRDLEIQEADETPETDV